MCNLLNDASTLLFAKYVTKYLLSSFKLFVLERKRSCFVRKGNRKLKAYSL